MNEQRGGRVRALIDVLKASARCPFCGETDPVTFDFHHLDQHTKDSKVAKLVNGGASIQRVVTEIEKCAILCSNCHRRVHAGTLSAEALIPMRIDQRWLDLRIDVRLLRETATSPWPLQGGSLQCWRSLGELHTR